MGFGFGLVALVILALSVYVGFKLTYTPPPPAATATCEGTCSDDLNGCTKIGDTCETLPSFVASPVVANCPTGSGCTFTDTPVVATCTGTCSDDLNGCTNGDTCETLPSFVASPVAANCPTGGGCTFTDTPVTAQTPQTTQTAGNSQGLAHSNVPPHHTRYVIQCREGSPCPSTNDCMAPRTCSNGVCPPETALPNATDGTPTPCSLRQRAVGGKDGVVAGICKDGYCWDSTDAADLRNSGANIVEVAEAIWPDQGTTDYTWASAGEPSPAEAAARAARLIDSGYDAIQVVPGENKVWVLYDNGIIYNGTLAGGYVTKWSSGPFQNHSGGGATQIDVGGSYIYATGYGNSFRKHRDRPTDNWERLSPDDDEDGVLHISGNGDFLWRVKDNGMFGDDNNVDVSVDNGTGYNWIANDLDASYNDSLKMLSVSPPSATAAEIGQDAEDGIVAPDIASYVWGVTSEGGDVYRALVDGQTASTTAWASMPDDLDIYWISASGRKNIWATVVETTSDNRGIWKCSKPCELDVATGKIPWEKIDSGTLRTIDASPYANEVWGANDNGDSFNLTPKQ